LTWWGAGEAGAAEDKDFEGGVGFFDWWFGLGYVAGEGKGRAGGAGCFNELTTRAHFASC
jgi:hypothetical protein